MLRSEQQVVLRCPASIDSRLEGLAFCKSLVHADWLSQMHKYQISHARTPAEQDINVMKASHMAVTCVAWRAHGCDREAVILVYGIAKVTHLQEWPPFQVGRILEQNVVQLDVSVDHTHSAVRQQVWLRQQVRHKDVHQAKQDCRYSGCKCAAALLLDGATATHL